MWLNDIYLWERNKGTCNSRELREVTPQERRELSRYLRLRILVTLLSQSLTIFPSRWYYPHFLGKDCGSPLVVDTDVSVYQPFSPFLSSCYFNQLEPNWPGQPRVVIAFSAKSSANTSIYMVLNAGTKFLIRVEDSQFEN